MDERVIIRYVLPSLSLTKKTISASEYEYLHRRASNFKRNWKLS